MPLLLLPEPSLAALRWSLANLSDTTYRAFAAGALAGAATVAVERCPGLVELAVAPEQQGRGYGRSIPEWLVGEARRRGRRAIEVGTRNASLGNIAFSQKRGFRVAAVRRDSLGEGAQRRLPHAHAARAGADVHEVHGLG